MAEGDQTVWELENTQAKHFVMTAVHSFQQSYAIDEADYTGR